MCKFCLSEIPAYCIHTKKPGGTNCLRNTTAFKGPVMSSVPHSLKGIHKNSLKNSFSFMWVFQHRSVGSQISEHLTTLHKGIITIHKGM